MTKIDSSAKTIKHRRTIENLLYLFIEDLKERADTHDESKFHPDEKGPLDELEYYVSIHGTPAYGTPEYSKTTEMLKPMLEHHYKHNRHHPEHFSNLVNGMNLVDIVEMFMDWRAASIRGGEDAMNLSHSTSKYEFPEMLTNIFKNTADYFNFPYK